MELEYTSAGCNRCVGNIAWNDEGIVAFGSHRVVVLYNIQVRAFSCYSCSLNFAAWLHDMPPVAVGWDWYLIYRRIYVHIIPLYTMVSAEWKGRGDAVGSRGCGDECGVVA